MTERGERCRTGKKIRTREKPKVGKEDGQKALEGERWHTTGHIYLSFSVARGGQRLPSIKDTKGRGLEGEKIKKRKVKRREARSVWEKSANAEGTGKAGYLSIAAGGQGGLKRGWGWRGKIVGRQAETEKHSAMSAQKKESETIIEDQIVKLRGN